MARRAIKKTDFGTILLHWTLVALLVVAVATGLRIALDGPHDLHWLHGWAFLLPQSIVWTAHIPVGTALIALALAYAIYMRKAGLSRRVRPNLARLKGIAGRAKARYGALNILLYWALFSALGVELVTGAMLYIGYGGWAAEMHYAATWVIVAYVPAHIAVHYAIGGKWQLLRVFNPGPLAPRPAEFDPFELIAALASKGAEQGRGPQSRRPDDRQRRAPEQQKPPRPGAERLRGGTVLHAHPLVTAIAGGLGLLVFLLSLDTMTRDTLVIDQIAETDKPRIDGDISDPIWRLAPRVAVPTQQGANLDGTGQSWVEIRAVHDGMNAYFSFVWEDPTRSLKHLPMQKTENGWRVLQQGFDLGDATAYFEDKLAVLVIGAYVLIPGDRTFHAGKQPLADKPATLSGRGMHYTTSPGAYADMWQWHASTGGMMGWVDDTHFGPPTEPTQAQREGLSAYKGGFAPDPGAAMTELNFEERGPGGYDRPVTPKRLPKDVRKAAHATSEMDLDPNYGDGENSLWWLSAEDSVPYSPEQDARIPVGTVIPGVLVSGSPGGDRAHIRGKAKWASGRWSLEVVRRLDTGSKYDTPIATGAYMRVAVFDHTQSRHTRFIRPIRIEVNRCANAAGCISTSKDLRLSEAKSY